MAHANILDAPLHCRFLAAPVRWEIVENPRDPENPFFRPRLAREMKAKSIDPWKVRASFLRLPIGPDLPFTESDSRILLNFLNEVGLWEQPPYWEVFDLPKAEYQEGVLDSGHLVYGHPKKDFRFFGDAHGHLEWLMDPDSRSPALVRRGNHPKSLAEAELIAGRDDIFSLTFQWRKGTPMPTVTTLSFWEAVLLSLHIDYVKGAVFRVCARPDCGIPYPVINRHKRKYCSQYCGHLESLRRKRGTLVPTISKKGR